MTIIDQIVQSPRMPKYVEQLVHILEAERVAREKFYDWLPDDKKAEFINGEIVVHSPVKLEHESASSKLYRLLSTYVDKHKLGYVGHEKLLVCLTRNDYEPDVCFWRSELSSRFGDKQMKFPAPDLAIEVLSPSTEAFDRKVKFEDYAAHDTEEYWIVDPDARMIEQYLLEGDHYELAVKSADGTLHSRAIKGFEMPVQAAFDADANIKTLAKIISA